MLNNWNILYYWRWQSKVVKLGGLIDKQENISMIKNENLMEHMWNQVHGIVTP